MRRRGALIWWLVLGLLLVLAAIGIAHVVSSLLVSSNGLESGVFEKAVRKLARTEWNRLQFQMGGNSRHAFRYRRGICGTIYRLLRRLGPEYAAGFYQGSAGAGNKLCGAKFSISGTLVSIPRISVCQLIALDVVPGLSDRWRAGTAASCRPNGFHRFIVQDWYRGGWKQLNPGGVDGERNFH